MRRRLVAIVGTVLSVCAPFAVSCTDSNDDPVGRACRVIVRDCHALQDMSDCIDIVGELDADCVLCIGDDASCSYFSDCQRQFVTCQLPSSLEPPGSGDP